jgi:hypothetical protein
MHPPRLPAVHVWPAFAAALIDGLVEWVALSRWRAADALHAARTGHAWMKRLR